MPTHTEDTQIPPKFVVRVVAAILLLASLAVLFFSIRYFQDIGTAGATIAIIGGLSTALCAEESLRTGKPEWILLNLIFPW